MYLIPYTERYEAYVLACSKAVCSNVRLMLEDEVEVSRISRYLLGFYRVVCPEIVKNVAPKGVCSIEYLHTAVAQRLPLFLSCVSREEMSEHICALEQHYPPLNRDRPQATEKDLVVVRPQATLRSAFV